MPNPPADTDLKPFSARYKITEFRLDIGRYDAVSISCHRAEDIRHWWTDAGLPVVLRTQEKHIIPREDEDTDYNVIRVPDYMASAEWEPVEAFLVPDDDATRRLTGEDDAV